MIDLHPLNAATSKSFAGLAAAPGQASLIAPTDRWLAQCLPVPGATTYGLVGDGQPVGLMTLIDPREAPLSEQPYLISDCLHLWRLMIDGAYQRLGFGTAAVHAAMDAARDAGLNGLSLTTLQDHQQSAGPFYARLGFAATGRRFEGEVELVRRLDAGGAS